jgi:hypothetical protein
MNNIELEKGIRLPRERGDTPPIRLKKLPKQSDAKFN